MKKGLFIFGLAIVIVAGLFISVYLNAVNPLKKAEAAAIQIAKKEVAMVSVDEVSVYNGSETSYAVVGRNDKNEEVVAFIPEKEGNILIIKAHDGITKQQAITIVQQEKQPKKIVAARLGMENGIPLWEVYYESKDSALNYYYIDFKTGEWLKKIENL